MRVNILEQSSAIPWVLRGRNFISAIADWIQLFIKIQEKTSFQMMKN